MPSKKPAKRAAKPDAVKKKKSSRSRKPKITRVTTSEDRFYRIADSIPDTYLGDKIYLRDEAVCDAVFAEFSFDELMERDAYELNSVRLACGTPHFFPEVLPFLSEAIRRRDAKREALLCQLFAATALADDSDTLAKRFREHLRLKAVKYNGELTLGAIAEWALTELRDRALAEQAMREDERASLVEFNEIYRKGNRAAFAGVWSVLRNCPYLNPTEEDARECVNITLFKIWRNASEWSLTDATASIATRVRKFAACQAMGWRNAEITRRKREQALRVELSDYRGAKSAKKPSLGVYDEKRYDPKAA
ncbi:hypothetical protein [Terriglobus roseus]|uniref:Uncharacterized protein n=1 Tax=Terriglobus roseus TaxID=392734 RepID=A0A1G7QR94_9BACT|nr:hypothetical protein [Terriglobus roseus]SDG01047.1 hypothetical protein SAMN05444167_3968 [Terriglobus roseus]